MVAVAVAVAALALALLRCCLLLLHSFTPHPLSLGLPCLRPYLPSHAPLVGRTPSTPSYHLRPLLLPLAVPPPQPPAPYPSSPLAPCM